MIGVLVLICYFTACIYITMSTCASIGRFPLHAYSCMLLGSKKNKGKKKNSSCFTPPSACQQSPAHGLGLGNLPYQGEHRDAILCKSSCTLA